MTVSKCLRAHNFSACVTSQGIKQKWCKTAGRRQGRDRGLLGGGECQTEAAAAERRQRKWGGSVPSDHFLGHGAWPPPSGANHSILDNFLKHLNLFPALQHPHDQVPSTYPTPFTCLSVLLSSYWFLTFTFNSHLRVFLCITSPKEEFKVKVWQENSKTKSSI